MSSPGYPVTQEIDGNLVIKDVGGNNTYGNATVVRLAAGAQVSAPLGSAGANAGTSPPVPVVATGSTDMAGAATFGSGGSPAAGAQLVISFAKAYPVAPKVVNISETTGATAALNPYVTSIFTTGFTIATNSAPTASQANTVYGVSWTVVA